MPEPGHSTGTDVLVGVCALPVVKNECGLAKGLKRVLGLGSGLGRLGRGSDGSSLRLLLLLGGSVLDGLIDEDGVLNNGLEGGLSDNGLVPPGNGGVFSADLLVNDSGESAGEERSSEEISEGDALADEVGVSSEVGVEDAELLQGSLGSIVNTLLVVAVEAKERTEPGAEADKELRVGEGQPPEDGSVVLLGLAEKSGLLVLRGHFNNS